MILEHWIGNGPSGPKDRSPKGPFCRQLNGLLVSKYLDHFVPHLSRPCFEMQNAKGGKGICHDQS